MLGSLHASGLLLLVFILAVDASGKGPGPKPPKPKPQTYDYIVVGGGTAGNALATRLSQGLPRSKILVIEAGPAAPDELGILVPGLKGSTLGGKYDWNFTTVPQPALGNHIVGVPRGKVLGGSSALNLLVWDRAAAAEYDQWEEAGNPGWNWESMHAAMLRSENFTGGPPGSGTTGPIHSTIIDHFFPSHLKDWIPLAGEYFNVSKNTDSIHGNAIGASNQPANIDSTATRYRRSYSANSYLPLAGSNLEVLTDSLVVKINLEKKGSKHQATGVTLANGTVIQANKEVIISAGAIGSPNLLELSGIGQASVLRAAKINQLINLPGVGENFQDHLRVQTSYHLKKPFVSTTDTLRYNTTYAAAALEKYLAGERGPLDFSGGGFIFANWNQTLLSGDDTALVSLARDAVGASSDIGHQKKLAQLVDRSIPQVEVIFSDGYTGAKGYPAAGTPLRGDGFFTVIGGLMHPLSRGSVHIDPSNPLGKPIIDPKYLDNEYDRQAMVELAKFCRRLALSEPMRGYWDFEYEPGLDVVQTEEQWREFALATTLSIFHPIGTAAMLPKKGGGVVDPKLVVYGTENLRVADASIIPVEVSAHIQTAVYGIAERAAEIIVQGAGLS